MHAADSTLDVIVVLRLAYLSAALLVLLISAVPAFSTRFLAYGPRSAATPSWSTTRKEQWKQKKTVQPWLTSQVLDQVANIRVPHGWFTSFYAVSVTCSLFWAAQLMTRGPAFHLVKEAVGSQTGSMTIRQVFLAWLLLAVQGSRRLYECLAFSQPSNSQMWVGHWILGIGFYVGTSVAIWVEGTATIATHTFTMADASIAGPNVQIFIGILLFILASGFQHDCHAYLASLKIRSLSSSSVRSKQKLSSTTPYKLPEHPAFSRLTAPHYTAECFIYLSLALIATPAGAWINWTVACACIFVAVNLGVTAAGTNQWYERTFGHEAVERKWNLIPLVW